MNSEQPMRPKVLTPRSHQVFDRRRPSRPNRVDGVGFANRNDAATLDVTGWGEVFSCSSALRSDLSRIALGIDAYKGGYGRRKCAGAEAMVRSRNVGFGMSASEGQADVVSRGDNFRF
jgi:hypothetical protein